MIFLGDMDKMILTTGFLNEKQNFKINYSQLVNCKLRIEEPDENFIEVYFSNEDDKISCQMDTSTDRVVKFQKLQLSYEITSSYLVISYFPTMIGSYRIVFTSNGKHISHSSSNLVVKEREFNKKSNGPKRLFQSSNKIISSIDSSNDSSNYSNEISPKINQSPQIHNSTKLHSSLSSSTTPYLLNEQSNQNEIQRSSDTSKIDFNLISEIKSSKVSDSTGDQLNEKVVEDEIKESIENDKSNESTLKFEVNTINETPKSIEEKRSSEERIKRTAKFKIAENVAINELDNQLNQDNKINNIKLLERKPAFEQLNESNGLQINKTSSDLNECSSYSFSFHFSPEYKLNHKINSEQLNQNTNQVVDSTKLVSKIVSQDKQIEDNCQSIMEKQDLIVQSKKQQVQPNEIEEPMRQDLLNNNTKHQINRNLFVDQLKQNYNQLTQLNDSSEEHNRSNDLQSANQQIEPNSMKQSQELNESDSNDQQTVQQTVCETSLNNFSQLKVKSECDLNKKKINFVVNCSEMVNSDLNSETNSLTIRSDDLDNNQITSMNEEIVFRKRSQLIRQSNTSSDHLDRLTQYRLSHQSNQLDIQQDIQLDSQSNHQNYSSKEREYSKNQNSINKSSSKLTVEQHHYKKSNYASSSNLNTKLERKSALSKKDKRSSLEPLLDGIDPNRKSLDNLFYKLYRNQVNGDELTDLEISNIYQRMSLENDRRSTGHLNVETNDVLSKTNSNSSFFGSSCSKLPNSQISQDEFDYLISCSNQNLTQNLTKNLSKISCYNLNDNDAIDEVDNQTSEDLVDGCREKINARLKIFQANRASKVLERNEKSNNQLNGESNTQLRRSPKSPNIQRSKSQSIKTSDNKFVQNRSKKKIGKRRVTPLYQNYEKAPSNQVDEIFIILKDDQVDNESNQLDESHYEPATHLIYDSLNQSVNPLSINELPLKSFNLNNESVIESNSELSDDKSLLDKRLIRPPYQSPSRLNKSSLNSSSNESLDELESKSDNEINKNVVDNHVLPVQQMVRHWITQTKNLNESDTNSTKRATVEIPQISSIKNKRAIFEQGTSLDDKENKPTQNPHHFRNLSLRKKDFTAWSDANDDSNEIKRAKDDKLKVTNHQKERTDKIYKPKDLTNQQIDFNQFKDRSNRVIIENSDNNLKSSIKSSKDLTNYLGILNNKVKNTIRQSSAKDEHSTKNHRSSIENGFQAVNVKQKKSFWENLCAKKKNVLGK